VWVVSVMIRLFLLESDLFGEENMKKKITRYLVQNLCFFVGGALITSGIIIATAQRAEAVCSDNGCSGQPAGCSGGLCRGLDSTGAKCGCVGKSGSCECK